MDRMAPLDLDSANLPKKLGGYERRAVDSLLERAAAEMLALRKELQQAQAQIARLDEDLSRYRLQETALKESLLLAHKAADETRTNAHKEAQIILQEAARHVADLQAQSQKRINDMRWELERLGLEKQRFESRFRSLLQEHLDAIALPKHQPALVNLEMSHDEEEESAAAPSGPHTAAG